jgi:hypothetical protein
MFVEGWTCNICKACSHSRRLLFLLPPCSNMFTRIQIKQHAYKTDTPSLRTNPAACPVKNDPISMQTKSTQYPVFFFRCSIYKMTAMISIGASQTSIIVQRESFSRDVIDDKHVPLSSQIERLCRVHIAIFLPCQKYSWTFCLSLTRYPARPVILMMNSSIWQGCEYCRSVITQIPLCHILCRDDLLLSSGEEAIANNLS